MDKKGYIGESIVNLWSIILIVLVIIGFWLLFNVSEFGKKGVEPIIESELISENNKLLIDYLRSDVFVDEKKMNFADLIAISYLEYKREMLRGKTIEFMEKNDLCFDLIIYLFDLPAGELEFARRVGFDLKSEVKIKGICSEDITFLGKKKQYSIKPSYAYIPVLSQLVKVELILYE